MGGPGSGSYYRSTAGNTVENCRSIDIRKWHRGGHLRAGSRFDSWWTSDGEEVARINVRVESLETVILSFRSRSYWEDEWESVEQRLPITWTACNYGGERPWFICSVYRDGRYCGRRVARLFAGGKLFACRHCYQLGYQSQREPAYGRAMLKAQNIRIRLGGSASSADPFPEKPKGMHWRTYWRLWEEAENADIASWAGAAARFGVDL